MESNEEKTMRTKMISMLLGCILLACTLLVEGQAAAEYPLIDKVAAKVIEKYQTSTCEQLQAQKQQPKEPPGGTKAKAIDMLRKDPQMRQHFLNKIAAPIANKLFECGMIP
jgi:hypothetical protein